MIKSMFLGLVAVTLASGVSGEAVAQARLAVGVDVAPTAQSTVGATQGWTACVASYIRSHSEDVRDPDDAADAAFGACRALQVSSRPGEPRPVYVRDDASDQATRYSMLTADARLGADAR